VQNNSLQPTEPPLEIPYGGVELKFNDTAETSANLEVVDGKTSGGRNADLNDCV